ncbi:uncharacterized protein LOC142344968 [Convolutriloba macropyga]|uniref:uncharacterized protein LOC142344968 n=1 Tax=Convolutriloba macropyga TaxID=536237 RepID=UPI003F52062B
MCVSGVLIGVGLFLIDLVIIFLLFGHFDPIYYIGGENSPDVTTTLTFGVWELCVSCNNSKQEKCFSMNHSMIPNAKAALNEPVTVAFGVKVFLIVGSMLAACMVVMGCLACCSVINLERGLPYILLVVGSVITLLVSLICCALLTSDYRKQAPAFNDMKRRPKSFFKLLLDQVVSNWALFDPEQNQLISEDLKNKQFQLQFGWILGVLWVAPFLAFVGTFLFGISRCLPTVREKAMRDSELAKKSNSNSSSGNKKDTSTKGSKKSIYGSSTTIAPSPKPSNTES